MQEQQHAATTYEPPADRFEVRVLGPVLVSAGGRPRTLGGHRPRTLIAALLARVGATVSRDELITEAWGDAPPRTAVDTLHSYVSRLRRALRDVPLELETLGAGYLVEVDHARIDAARFEEMVRRGQAAIHAGRPAEGSNLLRSALRLWQGDAYGDVVRGPIVDAETHRLEELRAAALDDRIDADLACGQVTALLPELDALARAHPLRERIQAQRMLALYRAGRQAEALAAFQETRTVLIDELGIEPGPLLRELQTRILAQDPDLTTATTAVDDGGAAIVALSASADGNLPDPMVEVVALDEQAGELADLIRRHRLVTATGLSGSGKTTLALAAARLVGRELPDGVWFVPVPLGGASADIAASILSHLRLPSTADPCHAAVDALRERTALLVLDDADRAPGAAALVDGLLASCRHLRVLATGQRRLQLAYEQRHRVRMLQVPDPGDTSDEQLRADASRLLLHRISRWSPQFSVDEVSGRKLVRVARALDGLPLALEIAAECCELTGLDRLVDVAEGTPETLVGRTVAAGGATRSVAALLERTLASLPAPARLLLDHLAVFDAGFTSEAMEAIHIHGPVDREQASLQLAALADSSAIEPQATTTGVPRFAVPHLLRRAVRTGLPAHQRDHLSFRHAGYYGSLAESAGPGVIGPDQVHWLNRLHEEQPNLRQALKWSLDTHELAVAMRIISGAWRFWFHFGHRQEGFEWVQAVLTADPDGQHAGHALRQRFHFGGGLLAMASGDLATARDLLDRSGLAARAAGDPGTLAVSLAGLAEVTLREGGRDAATGPLREAELSARRSGDAWCIATVRQAEGVVLRELGAHDAARQAFDDAEDSFRDAGDEWSACLARLEAARVATVRGDLAAAVALHRTNLARTIDLTATTFDFIGLPDDMRGLATLAARAGHRDLARELKAAARSVEGPAVQAPARRDARDLLQHALDETRILALNS